MDSVEATSISQRYWLIEMPRPVEMLCTQDRHVIISYLEYPTTYHLVEAGIMKDVETVGSMGMEAEHGGYAGRHKMVMR